MHRRRFVAHVNPDHASPFDRIRKGGLRFRAAGENLASGFESIELAQAAFMDEPPYQQNHRGNVLNPAFSQIGIGIVQSLDGTLIITQNFISRA